MIIWSAVIFIVVLVHYLAFWYILWQKDFFRTFHLWSLSLLQSSAYTVPYLASSDCILRSPDGHHVRVHLRGLLPTSGGGEPFVRRDPAGPRVLQGPGVQERGPDQARQVLGALRCGRRGRRWATSPPTPFLSRGGSLCLGPRGLRPVWRYIIKHNPWKVTCPSSSIGKLLHMHAVTPKNL